MLRIALRERRCSRPKTAWGSLDYVLNDPVNLSDPSGLFPGLETSALAASWGALGPEIGYGVASSGPGGWLAAGLIAAGAAAGGAVGYAITPYLPTYDFPGAEEGSGRPMGWRGRVPPTPPPGIGSNCPTDEDDGLIEGRPPTPERGEMLDRRVRRINSQDFLDFLERSGISRKGWHKIMETWRTPNGSVERHYWANDTGRAFYYR
jgi:hypothetical protein